MSPQTEPSAPPVSAASLKRSRLPPLVALAGLLFLTAYSVGLIIRPSEIYLRIQSNVIYNIPALAALGLATIPIRRSRSRQRLGWLCLAVLLLTWQIADWMYSYYDLVLHTDIPFPGYADIAYYIGYFGFLAAIPLLTFPEQQLRDRRWLVDASIVMVVAGTIAWEYIMKAVVTASGDAYFDAAVALGYPLLDLGLLTALVVTLYASAGKFSRTALFLGAAAVLQIVTDAGYTYAVTTVGYDNVGNPLELGWLAAYVLLAICVTLPDESISQSRSPRQSLAGLALPYVAGVPLAGLLVASAARGRPSIILIMGAIGAVGLILARQFLTLRDNLRLLVHAANHDPLTGVPNRRRFEEDVRRELASARRHGAGGALLLLDLDDLKAVNDSLGHHAGDEVLRQLTHALSKDLPEPHKLYRLGSDEFAMLLLRADARKAQTVAQQILQMTRQRAFLIGGQPVRTTVSIGSALLPEQGAAVDELLAHADLALYEAKELGGNGVCLYNPRKGGQALSESRLVWKGRIREALENDLFVLHCQPILDLRSGQIHEYELLLRMQGDDGKLILPGAFLHIAERSGLIHDIDRWVVQQAIHLIAQQQRRGSPLRLAVNLSGKAFEDSDLLHFIQRQLTAAAVPPASLTLELTETAAIADVNRGQKFINSLKRLGCQFALDDFGVGFSTFYHLKHLPVDYLKIDGSFIRDLHRDEVDQHLVKAMVEVARGLNKRTVAECVEDEETLRLLREIGVDYGQGYYLGRPAPVSNVLAADPLAGRRAA